MQPDEMLANNEYITKGSQLGIKFLRVQAAVLSMVLTTSTK